MRLENIPTYSIDDIRERACQAIDNKFASGVEVLTEVSTEKKFSVPAPNIIEWCVRPEYLDSLSLYDYPREYQVLRDFYQLRCPICNKPDTKDCWGKSRESLGAENLLVWDESVGDDVCPRCRSTRAEFEQDGLLTIYNILVGIVGMRSGKSTTSGGYIGTYGEHRAITAGHNAGSLDKYFDQMRGQNFEISFAATTAGQAKKTSYIQYREARAQSPWFQEYVAWVKEQEKLQKAPVGMKPWYYSEDTDTNIHNGLLRLDVNSVPSNSAGLAGATRINAFVDELARFDTTESKRSAKEMWRVMNHSLRTVRSATIRLNLPKCFGALIGIGSPISDEDYAMGKYKESPKIKMMYSFKYATWEYNPYETREMLQPEFDEDPVGAERDYGANPPGAELPWIDDWGRFCKAVEPQLKPICTFNTTWPVDATGREYVGKALVECARDGEYEHAIAGDAGKSGDSFAVASAHGEYRETILRDGTIEEVWCTVFDWIFSIRPDRGRKLVVYYLCIAPMIKEIARRQKIGIVNFDHWNSDNIVQEIRSFGIDVEQYAMNSLKIEDYREFKNAAYGGRVILFPQEPGDEIADPKAVESPDGKTIVMSDAGKALWEMQHLERSMDLKKIDHPDGGSSDLAEVVINCHRLVQDMSMSKYKKRKNTRQQRRMREELSTREWNRHLGEAKGGGRPISNSSMGINAPQNAGAKRGLGGIARISRWS